MPDAQPPDADRSTTPPAQPWTPPTLRCDEAQTAISALLIDDHDPSVDHRALEAHLARCPTCAWPAALVAPRHPGGGRPAGSRPAARRPARRRWGTGRRAWIAFSAVAVLVAVVVIGPAVYFRLQGKPPPKLTLAVGPGGATGPLNGTWQAGAGSVAEYRVDEDLFDQQHLAVGRTTKVSGSITIAGQTVTSGRFVVDMASISSGNAGRDTVFRDHLLDTSSHPDATFTLTRAIDMGNVPADGSQVTEQATGTLTMRGVTQPVTFPLVAERRGTQLDVTGDLTVTFARWHIPDPSFAITKVSPTGDIDLLLLLSRHSA